MEGIITLLSRFSLIKPKEKEENINSEREIILEQLKATSKEIEALKCCFDHETNYDLIDSYIMAMDSLEKRYSYLIKKAKRENIVAF